MIRSFGRAAIAAVAIAAMIACKDVLRPELPVASLSAPDTVSGLEHDTVLLALVLKDSLGHTLADAGYVWRILDSTVARLDSHGRLVLGRVGTTTAVVMSGGLTHTVRVTTLARYALIASGSEYLANYRWCGVTTRGGMYCLPSDPVTDSLIPMEVPDARIQTLAVGAGHACAVTVDHVGWCWGDNRHGELGSDSALGGSPGLTMPVKVKGSLAFRSIDAGQYHSCGVTTAGAVYCWGLHSGGLLGDGDSSSSGAHPAPVRVALATAADTVVAGGDVSCALLVDHSVWCWGYNGSGALGTGIWTPPAPPYAWSPVHVIGSGGSGISYTALSASTQTVCGLTSDAAASCWGRNWWGQAGNIGDTLIDGVTDVLTPNILLPVAFKQVGIGGVYDGGTTCGLATAGAAWCWGANWKGEVGNGDTISTNVPTPVAMLSGITFSAISVGDLHACGLTKDGIVWCWGYLFGRVPRPLPFQQ